MSIFALDVVVSATFDVDSEAEAVELQQHIEAWARVREARCMVTATSRCVEVWGARRFIDVVIREFAKH